MAVSNRDWAQFSASDYSPAEWRAACLVDRGVGDPDHKGRYAVPVREPSGDVNRQAVLSAARLGHEMVGLTDAQRQTAARRLVRIMREDLSLDPPDGLLAAAGIAAAHRSADPDHEQYRQFDSGLHVREGGDGRTIEGIVVPYNRPTRINDELVEQFNPGVFAHQMRAANRIKLGREHIMLGGTLIGAGRSLEDRDAGAWMTLRVANTPIGDETLALVKDEALDELSVMFRERQNKRLGGGVIARVKADLIEVAVVLEGAYGRAAKIAAVRSADGALEIGDNDPVMLPDAELRRRAERYLVGGGLPEAKDPDLTLRVIRLGMPTG